MSIVKRLFTKTPNFFKNLRNISILLTAIAGSSLFSDNETVQEIAKIVGAITTAVAVTSQLPKEHE